MDQQLSPYGFFNLSDILQSRKEFQTWPINPFQKLYKEGKYIVGENSYRDMFLWKEVAWPLYERGDITAIIGDDPDQVMKIAVTTTAGGTTIGSASSILVGANMAGGTQTGSSSTGNSSMSVVGASANASGGGFRVLNLVPDTQESYSSTYVSGGAPAATSVVVSGLPVGAFLPIGTDVFNVVNGQLQFTGATLSAASTVSTTGNTTLTVTAVTTQVVGTVALVVTPEVLVKFNFGAHRYYVA